MFVLKTSNLIENEAFYYLHSGGTIIDYLGHCPLTQIARMPDAHWHPNFGSVITNPEYLAVAEMVIFGIHPFSSAEAHKCYWDMYERIGNENRRNYTWQPQPPIKTGRKTRCVYCVEDQREYESASAAAQAYGINDANMSRHLKGKSRSVGGKSFRYSDESNYV